MEIHLSEAVLTSRDIDHFNYPETFIIKWNPDKADLHALEDALMNHWDYAKYEDWDLEDIIKDILEPFDAEVKSVPHIRF